jgi:hypothetical protein
MDKDIIIGIILVFTALGFILYLTFRCRRTIELIHKKNLKSAREIIQKLNGKR